MDVVFGFVGYDFALLVADRASVQQIIVQNSDEDKIVEIDGDEDVGAERTKGDPWRSGIYTSERAIVSIATSTRIGRERDGALREE